MPDRDTLARVSDARRRLGIVVNPGKFDDLTATRSLVDDLVTAAGWPAPRWYETTPDDMGVSMTKQALDDGATIVASLGGDGTVRGVATVLAGGPVPLGLLPGGTGNLLARNLGLPLDLEEAVGVLLRGGERVIDTVIAHCTRPDGTRFDERFLVMAGFGLDAEIMEATSETLKARIGWLAYVVSAIPRFRRASFRVRLADASGSVARRCQVVVFGNCGTITGGVDLIPEARMDDGRVDALVVSARGWSGWSRAVVTVASGGRRAPASVIHRVSARFRSVTRRQQLAQVDGDPVGSIVGMDVETDARSLTVRVAG